MASTVRPSTPPPPSSINTPSTPRHGFHDDYQPYSPRKSARVLQRSRDAKTPPPQSSYTSSAKRLSSSMTSPSSPQTAPKKRAKNSPKDIGARRVSGALTLDNTVSAAAALGLPTPTPKKNKMDMQRATVTRNMGMLPTPDKTPKKRPDGIAPAVTSIARNLFAIHPGADEDPMPTPKKRGRKYKGFTLDSFEAEEPAHIQVYTDSQDRVPEVDLSSDNPFYNQAIAATSEPAKRASKRRKISVPGERDQTIEELEKRDDGLICVFRGKTIFRKFTDMSEVGSLAEDDTDDEVDVILEESGSSSRPFTRSSIKPRLLFPTAEQARSREPKMHTTEDEEADTDIEDIASGSNPTGKKNVMTVTPKAPRFGSRMPATPPTTARTTRSKKLDLGSPSNQTASDDESNVLHSPSIRKRSDSARSETSPFLNWQRVKRGPPGERRKRAGSPTLRPGRAKKLRA